MWGWRFTEIGIQIVPSEVKTTNLHFTNILNVTSITENKTKWKYCLVKKFSTERIFESEIIFPKQKFNIITTKQCCWSIKYFVFLKTCGIHTTPYQFLRVTYSNSFHLKFPIFHLSKSRSKFVYSNIIFSQRITGNKSFSSMVANQLNFIFTKAWNF